MFIMKECSSCKFERDIVNIQGLDCEELGKVHKWHGIQDDMCCECGRDMEYWLK